MTDGEQRSNHENTHTFTPIANELLEGAPQLVHVKVRGSVPRLSLSMRATVRAVFIVT